MTSPRLVCSVCGQDWLRPYRSLPDGRQFLFCEECESVWLPGEDPSKFTEHSLGDLFADRQFIPGEGYWDYVERVEPDAD